MPGVLGLERVAEADRLAVRARWCRRRGRGRRRASSSASTCRRRSRRPGRAPGRRAGRGRRRASTAVTGEALVDTAARDCASTGPVGTHGDARVTVACVTHFCRESGKSCLLDVQNSAWFTSGRADQRRLRAPAGRAAAHPGPARRGHRAGPLDDRRPDRRADAARAGGAVRRRGVDRRSAAVAAGPQPRRPGGRRGSTSAPRTPGPRSPTWPARSSSSAAPTSTSPTGPEQRAGLGGAAVVGELLGRAEPRRAPSWRRSGSVCPARSSTRPAGRSTRRSCPAGTGTTCRPTCSGRSTYRC